MKVCHVMYTEMFRVKSFLNVCMGTVYSQTDKIITIKMQSPNREK